MTITVPYEMTLSIPHLVLSFAFLYAAGFVAGMRFARRMP